MSFKAKSKLFSPLLLSLLNCHLSASLSPGKIENNSRTLPGCLSRSLANYPQHKMECLFTGEFCIDPVHLNMSCVSIASKSAFAGVCLCASLTISFAWTVAFLSLFLTSFFVLFFSHYKSVPTQLKLPKFPFILIKWFISQRFTLTTNNEYFHV